MHSLFCIITEVKDSIEGNLFQTMCHNSITNSLNKNDEKYSSFNDLFYISGLPNKITNVEKFGEDLASFLTNYSN